MKLETQAQKNYERAGNNFIIACFLMVAFMMASKLVYTAEMVEIMDVFGITEDVFGLPVTIYFCVYALVQVLLSIFMQKFNVKHYIGVTIAISCVLTCALAFSNGLTYFCIVLGVNGIFQAGVWAGCMYFLNKHLPVCMLPKANTLMTIGFPCGTVVGYGVSSLCVGMDAWWLTFIVVGILFLLVLVYFLISLTVLEKQPKLVAIEIDTIANGKGEFTTTTINIDKGIIDFNGKVKTVLFYVIIGVVCFMVYNIYSSIVEWIPKMLTDVYALDNSLAILFAIVVPVGVAIGPVIMIALCEKFANYVVVSLVGCVVVILLGVAVLFGYTLSVIIALVLLLLYAVTSRAVCAVYETVIVSKMKDKLNAGSFAAYTNATASIGAAAAPLIMGNVVKAGGWSVTYGVLICECVVMTLLILVVLLLFVRKPKSNFSK